MIPFLDAAAQDERARNAIRSAVDAVLEDRQFILGRHVEDFERKFADYCGVEHAIGVNSGTSALHLALLAAGVGAGDEVITVPFTFLATVATVLYCGARPVLLDIDPGTFNIDVEQIERAITPRTRALLPVHLFGQPANMDAILDLARRHGVPVIEDAAQAHGAEYHGRRAGSLGALGCFSFYPSKNLGAYGEGGMVTTNDAALARAVRTLRDWGQDRKYHHVVRGFNYRLEGMQAAVLGAKLPFLEDWTEHRRSTAALYDRLLEGADVVRPRAGSEIRHVYHTYTIRSARRDQIQRRLNEAGIGTAIHYPVPVHMQPAFSNLGYTAGDLPNAERASREVLSLPMYGAIPEEHVRAVAAAVMAAANV